MRDLQAQIISDLEVQPTIDPAEQLRLRLDFLKDYAAAANASGFLLGISGGQDSTLAGRLCQLASEELRESGRPTTFTAVRLPYTVQADEADAQLALEFIRPDKVVTFNIHRAVDGFEDEFGDSVGDAMLDFTKGNVKARVRMIAQYALAGQTGSLVVGTDHAAEAVTGFFTKFGDGGADVLPLSGLNKRQGASILKSLGAVERLYTKPPTADLLDNKPGQTDETELGLTYAEIDDFLEGKAVDSAVAEKIERRYLQTQHKRHLPVTMFDSWWRSS